MLRNLGNALLFQIGWFACVFGATRPWLLAPLTQPPAGQAARGKVICNCFDVAEDDILAAFRGGETLDALQTRTKCGTNCGSCVPELKRLKQSVAH